MGKTEERSTSATLLEKMKEKDDAAWVRFRDKYGPMIRAIGHSHGLQEADVQDVLQDVTLKAFMALQKDFRYDPRQGRYRHWLCVVAGNVVRDLVEGRARRGTGGDQEALQQVAGRDDSEVLLRELEAAVDQAVERVKQEVEPETWQAYDILENQGKKGKEVAELLGKGVVAVHKAASRVAQKIRAELGRLGFGPVAADEGET